MQSRQHSPRTITLLIRPTLLTVPTRIRNRFKSGPLSHLKRLHIRSNLDDYTGAFVAGATGAEIRHFAYAPVGEHEVEIGVADSGAVHFYEDVFWACGILLGACVQGMIGRFYDEDEIAYVV